MLGWEFTLFPAMIEEIVDPSLSPAEVALSLAKQKANHVATSFPDAVTLGADTVVELDSNIYGKPRDLIGAKDMLRTLSGRTHRVFTGLCLSHPGRDDVSEVQMTEVTMAPLTDADIDWYVGSGRTMDKAGGYGIQDAGAIFVESINGDFFNVMGLPLHLLFRLISRHYPDLKDKLFNNVAA